MSGTEYILEVEHLTKYYSRLSGTRQKQRQLFTAVDDVCLDLQEGRTLGILGESGCGKTTLARCLLGLIPIDSGTVYYKGKPVNLEKEKTRREWSQKIQIIFQDSLSSFDDKKTLSFSLQEALQSHGLRQKEQITSLIRESLNLTGVGEEILKRYPSQLSGGECQRTSIARALLLQPQILICDEPVSAMDLTIQMQILNLLKQLQEDRGLSYLFISHDLTVINYMSDEVAVIYRGSIVEKGLATEVLRHPLHPYSQMLLKSIPASSPFADKSSTFKQVKEDLVVSTITGGCKYYGKCPCSRDLCRQQKPLLKELGNNHYIACHYIDESL